MTTVARLRSLRRRLCADELLRCKYRDFMDDLLTKGYARKLTEDEAAARSPRTWYLPHHGVVQLHKPGKIRLVLDAAALHDGVSLNSQLNRGPDLKKFAWLVTEVQTRMLRTCSNLCSLR